MFSANCRRLLIVLAFGTAAASSALPVSRPATACSPDVFLHDSRVGLAAGPEAIGVADFNGDQIPDIAATGDGFALAVLLGNGDGTFGNATVLPGGPNTSLAVADFNHDGKQDVAVGRLGSVDVYLGNGDGSFQAPVTYPVPGGAAMFLVAGDVSGDGRADLIADAGTSVAVLINDGNGNFGPAIDYPAGDGYSAVQTLAVADVDGDGLSDIVVAGNPLSVLHNEGAGVFGPPRILLTIGAASVGVADMNEDGIPDIVCGRGDPGGPTFAGYVDVLIGNGDGTFQAPVETFAGIGPTRLLLQDMDGDGHVDAVVLISNLGPGTFFAAVLKGNGTGGFSSVTRYPVGPGAVAIAAGDFDGDGQTDVVAADNPTGDASLLYGNGAARLRSQASVNVGPGLGFLLAGSLLPGDFDGDGIDDVVAVGDGSVPMVLIPGNGDGTFRAPRPIAQGGFWYYGPSAAAGDFDGDGILDLAASSPEGTTILLGNGDGSFRTGQSDDNYVALNTGDFNGDGILDLLANQGINGGIIVAFGNGDGTFPTWVLTPVTGTTYAVTPFDIDGDGKTDVAFFAYTDPTQNGTLHVLLSNGDGTFRETYTRAAAPGGQGIFFADLTGDGKVDLLTAEGTAGTRLSAGHGDGTFDPPTTFDPQESTSAFATDFDGDGVIDVVTTNANPDGATFFKGAGGGVFHAPVHYPDVFGIGTAIATMTGSAPDLLLRNSGTFSLLLNSRLAPLRRDHSALVGTSAVLTVSASGYGALTYQWRKGGVPLSDGGTISGSQTATLTIDPVSFADAGSYDVVVTDGCNPVTSNPATLSVEFADVPTSSPFHNDILTIATAGITSGCGGSDYCPTSPVRRDQMAAFLLKAEHGSPYTPPPCTGLFADVPCPSTFANWVEQLAHEGVTSGCGGGNYCPSSSVTRAQMAVFLLKTKNGSSYVPPPAVGIFGDVPVGSFAADFIEALYNQGITGGCQASPLLYCPGNPVLRQQMATFLVRTFGLP